MFQFFAQIFEGGSSYVWNLSEKGSEPGITFLIQPEGQSDKAASVVSFLSDEDKAWLKQFSPDTHFEIDLDAMRKRFSTLQSEEWLKGRILVKVIKTYNGYYFEVKPDMIK
jgi:hypothetical protein